jgi:hypothetical protein
MRRRLNQMRHLAALIVSGALGAVALAAPDVSSRVITREIPYRKPFITGCELPGVVTAIARTTGVPFGLEYVPGQCPPPSPGAASLGERERVFMTGMTIGDALDGLVKLDSRYWWVESDGVIVVRPVAAWNDKEHFLHKTLASFAVDDQDLGSALGHWKAARANVPPAAIPHGATTELGLRRFSIEPTGPISAVSALDAITRAHRSLMWEVRYCEPKALPEYATVFLGTLEDRPTMLGTTLPERFPKVNGKTVDLCQGRM